MSTRGLYTFKGETAADTWNVYNHSDNYPTGAAMILQTALDYFVWQLPRYESDAFATGFIAACKCPWLWNGFNAIRFDDYGPAGKYRQTTGGGARMMPQGEPSTVAARHCGDIEYRYEISQSKNGKLNVKCYTTVATQHCGNMETYKEKLVLSCELSKFAARAKALEVTAQAAYEAKQAAKA
jgi:hypothetical protein